jgi:hypothetical protein
MAAKAKAVFELEKAAFGAVKAEQQKAQDEERATQLEMDREAARKMVEADQQVAAVQKQAIEAAMKKKTAAHKAMAPKTTVPKQDKDDRPKGPKKPRTAYVFFGKENRERIKASMPTDASMAEVTAEVSRQWGALADKTPYKTTADNDKERYQKELTMPV